MDHDQAQFPTGTRRRSSPYGKAVCAGDRRRDLDPGRTPATRNATPQHAHLHREGRGWLKSKRASAVQQLTDRTPDPRRGGFQCTGLQLAARGVEFLRETAPTEVGSLCDPWAGVLVRASSPPGARGSTRDSLDERKTHDTVRADRGRPCRHSVWTRVCGVTAPLSVRRWQRCNKFFTEQRASALLPRGLALRKG